MDLFIRDTANKTETITIAEDNSAYIYSFALFLLLFVVILGPFLLPL